MEPTAEKNFSVIAMGRRYLVVLIIWSAVALGVVGSSIHVVRKVRILFLGIKSCLLYKRDSGTPCNPY